MGLALVLGPTEEPVSLIEAKQHCRIDSTDDDGLLAGYILAARVFVEGQIHRPIVSRLYDYTIDHSWPVDCGLISIELPSPPLLAVRSVSYVDESGVSQTLSASLYDYSTDKARGLLYPAYDASWPSIRCQVAAATVRFVAGYTSFTDTTTSPHYTVAGEGVPDDLRQAILLLIGHWYENRESVNIGNIVNELPFTVEAILSACRVPYI